MGARDPLTGRSLCGDELALPGGSRTKGEMGYAEAMGAPSFPDLRLQGLGPGSFMAWRRRSTPNGAS